MGMFDPGASTCIYMYVCWTFMRVCIFVMGLIHLSGLQQREPVPQWGTHWGVWQWHKVTDRLRWIGGQWAGCADSVVNPSMWKSIVVYFFKHKHARLFIVKLGRVNIKVFLTCLSLFWLLWKAICTPCCFHTDRANPDCILTKIEGDWEEDEGLIQEKRHQLVERG